MKRLIVAALVAVFLAPIPAHADTRYRKWNGMQTGEVVVCYGRSGAGTFAVSRRSTNDGPDRWQTWTHCEQNPYGYRAGRWVQWHDRQTGEVLWCYGRVRFRPIEGAREGAQWAKCADRNLGRIG